MNKIELFVDEAGEGGYIRNLTKSRDNDIFLLAGIVFAPELKEYAHAALADVDDHLKSLLPDGAKAHITDLDFEGKTKINAQLFELFEVTNPGIFYSARRYKLAIAQFERDNEMLSKTRDVAKTSSVVPQHLHRPVGDRIEEWVFQALMTKVDVCAQVEFRKMLGYSSKVDIVFDQIDHGLEKEYATIIENLKQRDKRGITRKGFDRELGEPFEEQIIVRSSDPLDGIEGAPALNAISLGSLRVAGKSHSGVLAADIVASELLRHLRQLPVEYDLNTKPALRGYRFERWAMDWTENTRSLEDIY